VGRIVLFDLSFTPVKRPVNVEDVSTLDWFIGEVIVKDKETGLDVCRLQQGSGHCCGATYITQMYSKLPDYIDDLVAKVVKSPSTLGLRWPVQKQLFFYLSEETKHWDAPIRTRPDVKALYSFKNYATKPYSGSNVTLFVLELP
jgi:hypothetical protein